MRRLSLVAAIALLGCLSLALDDRTCQEQEKLSPSGFRVYDYSAYPEFYHNESVIKLAQTGTYTGPKAIEEYVRFTGPGSPYVSSQVASRIYSTIYWEAPYCVHLFVFRSNYQPGNITLNANVNITGLYKLYFNIATQKNDYSVVYYPLQFLDYFYHTYADTHEVRVDACQTMMKFCPYVAQNNSLSSLDECVGRLASLPMVSSAQGHVDGYSQGCRLLHVFMATLNDKHCPHLSFTPMIDIEGKLKCQVSEAVDPAELFDPSDIRIYELAIRLHGFPESGFTSMDATLIDGNSALASLDASTENDFEHTITSGTNRCFSWAWVCLAAWCSCLWAHAQVFG